MAHVVAANDAGAVREAVGMPVVRGAEKQRRGIDRAGSRHDNVGGEALRLAVALDMDYRDLAAGGACFQAGDFRVSQQRDVGVLERGIHAADVRVGLRIDQTRMAVARAASNARTCLRISLVEHDAERRVKRT